MENIELKHFSAKAEARLLKLDYDVLPVSVGETVNMTVEDEVTITRIEKNSITFECKRALVMNPKSVFEMTGSCYVKRIIDPKYESVNLLDADINTFVQMNLANLVSVAFSNLSHIFSSITSSFGGAPFITPPTPVPSTKIYNKAG